ncbi:cytochrome P450 [Streptomyces acidiscabies]|uniref:cytochrome P450 n=1 Tax=Streptomyces acidiscabies TaxID=42234 RepID=UPI000951EBF3|nr:cytochrome P450 [Streptomyces acidiscabies]
MNHDLADPTTYAEQDMVAYWRHLRREDPVHWQPGTDGRPGFWVISRYHDVQALHRDTENFASGRGNVLAALLSGGDTSAGRMLPVTDAPRHPALRAVMSVSFTPRALRRVQPRIEENARELVRRAAAVGSCDFATEVAEQIPLHTICDLLDVPAGDRAFLLGVAKQSLGFEEPDEADITTRLARMEIVRYFQELSATRRSRPGDDAISALVSGEVQGERLSDEDVALNCYSLLLGGDETARLTIIEAVRALAEHPGQWRDLKSGDIDLAVATDEVLRWATPAMHTARHATRDTTLHGRQVRAGDLVTLWLSSANRDEEVFAAPDTFDLRRSPNRHVSFGFGTHFCVGAQLARMEIKAVLSALRDHVPDITLTGPGKRIYSTFLNGYSSLPVSFRRATRGGPGGRSATAGSEGGRRVKLFCVPFAGGSVRAFQPLTAELRPEIETVPLERAGRDGRHQENPDRTFDDAVEDIVTQVIRRSGDEPYALYGYSLGGLLAYEAARRLMGNGHRAPRHLFVSASRPPQRSYGHDGGPAIHTYPDLAFLGALASTGGVPEEFLHDADTVSYFTSLIRNDYELYAQYAYSAEAPRLTCPVTVVTGSEDPVTSHKDVDLWAELTSGSVTHLEFGGAGHFFLDSHAPELARHIHTSLLGEPAQPAALLTPDLFRDAMARLAAPVTVITTRDPDGRPRAFTASAVCSLSAEPPLLLVCVNGSSSSHDVFTTTDRFLVNVLNHDQADAARAFAHHDRATAEAALVPLELGLPGLPDASARYACTRRQVLPGGDHSILTGRLESVSVSDRPPLIHYERGWHRPTAVPAERSTGLWSQLV